MMGKQLTSIELEARRLFGQRLSPVEIHKRIAAARARQRQDPPVLTTVRRFLKAKTHRADKPETRGRKAIFKRRSVLKMNAVRKSLVKKADGEYEVHWADVVKKARMPKADPTTVARAFAREGIAVSCPPPPPQGEVVEGKGTRRRKKRSLQEVEVLLRELLDGEGGHVR